MTRATRSDALSIHLCVRRVAAKARHMRIHSRRNGQPSAAAISSMARRTTSASRGVRCVIEGDVETPQRWKSLDLSTLCIGVTDRANLTALVCKLLLVTTGARRMCRFARQGWLR